MKTLCKYNCSLLFLLHVVSLICWFDSTAAWSCLPNERRRRRLVSHRSVSETSAESPASIHDSVLQQQFRSLLTSATTLREAITSQQSHDPFRYEWGTWVDPDKVVNLMAFVNSCQVQAGIYDQIVVAATEGETRSSQRYVLLESTTSDWDCYLHILPMNTAWQGQWPAGSWAIVKPLLGVTQVGLIRDDGTTMRSSKTLRGGSDMTANTVGGGGSTNTGDESVKFVGGPLRRYTGKSGKTMLLEIVLRPPVGKNNDSSRNCEHQDDSSFELTLDQILQIVPPPEETTLDETTNATIQNTDSVANAKETLIVIEQSKAGNNKQDLGTALGMKFDQVGGLEDQLEAIARRVLASRANPHVAKRLGISHVRGILLSGPPGCGKTLLARELARLLGAREPQIVNGPEILDKFIGEAEKKVRALFEPAEREYAAVGDESALHIIILDEMDAIAKKRGSATSDSTGVRDSVVNQLLAKMDGVNQANNILVVGLTNRPELLDPALLRPGRLEVHLRVELPDRIGRRDILRIHTRKMKEEGALATDALALLEDLDENGMPAQCEHFTGAELAGLVRSAASFALARCFQDGDEGYVTVKDLEQSLSEVRPALGRQDELLKLRFPMGISLYSSAIKRIVRDLDRFTLPLQSNSPRHQSLLLVGGGNNGGSGATALAAWAAAEASQQGRSEYVRFITAVDVLAGEGGDSARATALMERFSEAREMSTSLLLLDDVDQLCAGNGPGGYSNVMLATLRALLRTPPESASVAKAGGQSKSKTGQRTMNVIGVTSRSDAACSILVDIFDETLVVPLLSETNEIEKLLADSLDSLEADAIEPMAAMLIQKLNRVGCKTALRLVERALTYAGIMKLEERATEKSNAEMQIFAFEQILDDLTGDEVTARDLCEVI